MNKKKSIPKFKSEAEERNFWSKNDSTDYLDWSKAKRVHFPNLKATSRTISIRLPESLIEEIKILANKQDVPYQSMLKILLADKVQEKNTVHRGKRESRLTSRSS
jgi:predicted DNA binding CopG/RHH family protein